MLLTILLLATLMAILGVVGYFQGARAAFFMTVMILFGMLLIQRAGGGIAKLVNGLYFGIRFVLAGGVQALGSGGGSAAISAVIDKIGPVQPLIDPNSPGPELLVVLLIAILVSWWLGRIKRLPLRGSTSGWGIVWGLLNGYILGAYLLWSLAPSLAGSLPVPFGVGQQAAAGAGATGAAASATGAAASLTDQLLNQVQTASDWTLAVIVMILIALFIIIATLASTRGGSRSRRNGTS